MRLDIEAIFLVAMAALFVALATGRLESPVRVDAPRYATNWVAG